VVILDAICISRPKKPEFFSRVIFWSTGRKGSHIFAVKDGLIYHCTDTGVAVEPLEFYLLTNDIIETKHNVPLDRFEDLADFKKWHGEFIVKGVEYSFSQLLIPFIPPLRHVLANGRAKGACMEYICWLMFDGTGRKEFRDGERLTPYAVFEMI
jgi:hypothetical protein